MAPFNRKLLTTILALALPAGAALAATVPYPSSGTPTGRDIGALTGVEAVRPITVTVAMKLHDPDAAAKRLAAISDPKSVEYHQFVTPEQFRTLYGPTPAEVARVTSTLTRLGLSVERASTTTLKVTGSPEAIQRAFEVTLHTFEVGAHAGKPGYTYRAPLTRPSIPEEAASLVHAVVGLSTQPQFRPHMHRASEHLNQAKIKVTPATGSSTGNEPGLLTVTDFANQYNVTPLYGKGISGKGKTVGIVTLASFTPSDAFAYWSAVGLTVDPNRITVVNIDGGAGAPSDASGSDETTLDVEQSGGVAPGAKIIVYVAPNTNQAFVDAFAEAVESNKVDTLSTSWGEWEWFDNLENSPVADPNTGRTVSSLRAMDELFLQAALQGQSLFASAGDAGAYDANDGVDNNGFPFVPPYYSLALSVDFPASSPYITAAGGTTLPGTQTFTLPGGLPNFSVTIKNERVWSWDYLNPLCAELGYDPISCGIFPVGGGGGVSVEFPTPFYQAFTSGVQRSQPGQSFITYTTTPPTDYFDLPAHYPGRNLPDISANADPDTGYIIYYTSDQNGPEILTFIGGTSFVAPQLNGVTSLFNQYSRGRVGLLNLPAYLLADIGGYRGPNAPLVAIKYGNNDFYTGSNGYNPGAGLGVLNVYNFAQAIRGF